MKSFDIIPTAIGREIYPDNDKLKKDVFSLAKKERMEWAEKRPNLFHIAKDRENGVSFLYKEGLLDFKNWVEEQCTLFVKDVLEFRLLDKMIVTDSWLNLCNIKGSQNRHNHSNAFISGTYYLNFEKGHAPLRIVNPTTRSPSIMQSITLQRENENNKYTGDPILQPEEGELLLWQSHLTHGHSGNQKNDRVSISINFMPSVVTDRFYGFRVTPLRAK